MRNGALSAGGTVPFLVFAAGLLVAAAFDLRGRRIPNAVVAPLVLAGLAYNGALRGWSGIGAGLSGAGIGIAILIVPFAARLIGGGDVKLLGAVGAWLRPGSMGWVALWSAILGGILVIALLVRHRALRRAVTDNLTTAVLTREVPAVEARPRAQSVPLGVAIAGAALWVAITERIFAHA